MIQQIILYATGNYEELDKFFTENGYKSVFLVCDEAFRFLKLKPYFESLKERLGINVTTFSDFQPNPLYESVVKGVEMFRNSGAGIIVAVGGGSAMDVAKCIKLYSNMNSSHNYLEQEIIPNDTVLFAVPTTAGTGSEATRYAVIYYDGRKQSVTHDTIIPTVVLFDSSCLKTLPMYQKKSTMLDALCHSIESFWSVNSREESKEHSTRAIRLIMENMDSYLANDEEGNKNMLLAANTAGRAINITQTTAGHAMCYKLTSIYGVSHGHAAALVDTKLFPFMIANTDKCIDKRGVDYLNQTFNEIATAMGCDSPQQAAEKFQKIFDSLELDIPIAKKEDYSALNSSVNPVRLKNNPVRLDEQSINELYHQILG